MFNTMWREEEENKRNRALTSQVLSEKIKKNCLQNSYVYLFDSKINNR